MTPKDILDLDPVLHHPARLAILASCVSPQDFSHLARELDLTRGNLSSHLSRLESEGLVVVSKSFAGKTPRTEIVLSGKGRTSLAEHAARLRRATALLQRILA